MLSTLAFAVFCVFSQVHKACSIKCIECHSSVSWEDCIKRQSIVHCSSVFNRCVTYHKNLSLPNGEEQHEFKKSCYHDKSCSSFICNQPGKQVTNSRCSMKCCNTTLCNSDFKQSANDIPTFMPKRQHEKEENTVKNHLQKRTNKVQTNHKSSPLECFDCSSPYSWDDCIKNQTVVKCIPVLNVCVTFHRVLTHPSNHQENQYVKGCWHDKECSDERMRVTDQKVKGTWSNTKCCNSTMCNRGGLPNPYANFQVKETASSAKTRGVIVYTVLGAFVSVVSGFYISS